MSNEKYQKQLRVMLVDDMSDRRDIVGFALQQVDCVLVACVSSGGDLLSAVESCNPDVIIIDIEAPSRDTLEILASVQSAAPRPMVMFSQDDNNHTIRRATRAGISAYVVDGLQTARVRSVIDAAVARFHHYGQLQSELKNARRQLNERKTVERAKGIIMHQRGLSEEQAYQALRKLAMDTNRKVADVAQNIIEAATILSG